MKPPTTPTPGLRRRASFRVILATWFGLLSVAVVVLVSGVRSFGIPFLGIKGEYQGLLAEAIDDLSRTADLKKDRLSAWILERQGDLAVIRGDRGITRVLSAVMEDEGWRERAGMPHDELLRTLQGNPDFAALQARLVRTSTSYSSIRTICLVDTEDAQVICSSDLSSVGTPFKDVAALRLALGSSSVMGIWVGGNDEPDGYHLNFCQAVPQSASSTHAVAIVFHVRIEEVVIPMLYVSGDLGKTGEVVLVDSSKRLLMPLRNRPHDMSYPRVVEDRLTAQPAALAAAGSEGVLFAKDYRGVPVLAAFRHISIGAEGWGLVVKQDRSELLAPLWARMMVSGVVGLAGLAAMLAAILAVASHLTKPLRALEGMSRRVEAGDLSARGPMGGSREIAQLALSFNGMADRLEHWHQEKQLEIEDKTRRLSDELQIREQTLQALRTSEDQLSTALQMARAGYWEYDVATDTFTFNDDFYRIFRTTAAAVGGYRMSSAEYSRRFCHPDDAHAVGEETRAAIESADSNYDRTVEHRILYVDGEVGTIRVRFFIAKDSHGHTVKTYGVNQDITESKRAEEEHEKLRAQLTQAQKMESVGCLAGGVAHDFNNLLMGIMNYVELCRDHIEPDHPIREWLDEITSDAQRSATLVRQLLAFARKQTIAPVVLDLNDAVSCMLKMLRRLIGEDIDLLWQPGENVLTVKMDPAQLDQILANLCVNARDAIDGVGKITIETDMITIDDDYCAHHAEAVAGDFVLLLVSDNGCGMDRETLAHIFEPFFTTKGVGEGTGLGLATIYGIVKQNNGFLSVYSEPGRGTTFRIYLPRCEDVSTVAVVSPAKDVRVGGAETILLVEDEKSVRVTTRMFLTDLGYTVLAAESPEEAFRLAAAHDTESHLVITDVIMPGMDGRELAAQLAQTYPRMACLFMSGYTADVIAHRGILDDNVHFLSKPFSRDDLARKVREVLDGR